MLGWFIIISTQTPEERDAGSDPEQNLATWEAGLFGADWLKNLVSHGKALQLSFSGYPMRYTAAAGDVLPLIAAGPPTHKSPLVIGDDYVQPPGWSGNANIQHARIASCRPDQMLTIDAWDQS